ncbi:DUF4173 domain-containing protein [Kineosporia sp. NBRC 101731]|uniref:DUF4153 domain-containing protein n=1 Tax=Kineosporia sp. NBRC 101731 TaxID=3032199 RepID=UPI0024A0C2BF|nr:DUF4173 domain-containing protein [Kineosporia sp. NBRC 101731]GLY29569.1 hypothetical protein Kisp02_29340 [Kineosporia sp. NBRC 101731]
MNDTPALGLSTPSWADPPPPRLRLLAGALLCAVPAAFLLADTAFGINVPVIAYLIAATVLMSRPSRTEGHTWSGVVLTVIALLLSTVAVLRASEWLVVGCILASATLAATVALGTRTWKTLLATGFLFGEATFRAIPWAAATGRRHRPRRLPLRAPASVFSGLVTGLVCAAIVGALLASADAGFAQVLSDVGGWFVLDVPSSDVIAARIITFGVVTLFVLGLGFAASSPLRHAPDAPGDRHPAEWLVPLVLVTLTIAAFLAVDATRLFGAGPAVPDSTHAERAREGFGQLIVVTVLVLLLIGWAGRSAAPRHRHLLAAGGGPLLALTLLLAFSALRRLWLYMSEFGWTVTRFNAGAFELWVVGVLALVGGTWLARRTDLLPRLTAGSAGLGLLVVALAGPDAVVAAADVRRYERTGDIDVLYLSRLSPDAIPALSKLPDDVLPCALPRLPDDQPWYSWNLSRSRADSRSDRPAQCLRD